MASDSLFREPLGNQQSDRVIQRVNRYQREQVPKPQA
jgi:hypothetical protein